MFESETVVKPRCEGCEYRKIVHAQNNFTVYGCYHHPYIGKWVAEIRECPKTEIRICPVCNNEVDREDMDFTKDCHGITFRLVCRQCWARLMEKGYDGEYYTEADEQIEDNY